MATFSCQTGEVAGSIEVMTDITGHKETERMKNEMISAVNHEMRTPLTVLLGYLQYLAENRVDEAQLVELLDTMRKEAERLKGLIGNFLDLQHLRTNVGPYSFRPLAVQELLEEVAAIFAGVSAAHRMTIDAPAELPQVTGNRERLQEVISNLLSNAIKYSPAGGAVVLGAKPEGSGVTIWVRDEGIGIPRESLDKIFDTFYRVDNSARRLFRGTGLGLALVREIVTAHGGRVWAESTVGQGSTFYVALPAPPRTSPPSDRGHCDPNPSCPPL